MSPWNFRHKKRTISYYEPEEPALDEYIFCDQCVDIVYEYCAIHGPLLVVPDDKVPAKTGFPSFIPRAALTIPKTFLHLAPSMIPGAGIGVFSSMTLPKGVRFGPYRGKKEPEANSDYCWQIFNDKRKFSHVIDAVDANKSNWLRYVNCARHWCEQNLLAFQYQGQLYYRTIKIIPKFTELLVFYGSEFANNLNIDVRLFNCVSGIAKLTIAIPIKRHNEPKTEKSPKNMEIEPASLAMAAPKINEEKSIKITSKTSLNETKNIVADSNKTIKSNTDIIQSSKKNDNNNNKTLNDANDDGSNINRTWTNLNCNVNIEPKKNNITDSIKSIDSNVNENKRIKLDKTIDKNNELNKNVNKKFTCKFCLYSSNFKGSVEVHERVHTKEKPYKCTECTSAFTQLSHLITHKRIHSGEKPYKCTECNSAFNKLSNLITHKRIHSGEKPYKCTECNSAFNKLSNLITHKRIHSGEKPYKCTECTSAFSDSSALIKHKRIHSGEKPYQCNICLCKFTQSSNLNSHVKRKHNEA